jgi:hypothetical protein
MDNKYYVYIYLDPRKPGVWEFDNLVLNFEPFYVGKGSGKRFKSHLSKKEKHLKSHIITKIQSLRMEPIIIKIAEDLSEEEALDIETKTIITIGTRSKIENAPIGPLTNLKTDGTLQKYSDESRCKMSISAKARGGRNHSEETKLKMSNSALHRTEEEKQRISELLSKASKGKPKPKEHSERMSKLHRGKIISEEMKKKLSEKLTGRKKSNETCQKLSNVQKKEWTILIENSIETFKVVDLHQWCLDRNISYNTLYGTFSRNKFHKGYKIISKAGGTHFVCKSQSAEKIA